MCNVTANQRGVLRSASLRAKTQNLDLSTFGSILYTHFGVLAVVTFSFTTTSCLVPLAADRLFVFLCKDVESHDNFRLQRERGVLFVFVCLCRRGLQAPTISQFVTQKRLSKCCSFLNMVTVFSSS